MDGISNTKVCPEIIRLLLSSLIHYNAQYFVVQKHVYTNIYNYTTTFVRVDKTTTAQELACKIKNKFTPSELFKLGAQHYQYSLRQNFMQKIESK